MATSLLANDKLLFTTNGSITAASLTATANKLTFDGDGTNVTLSGVATPVLGTDGVNKAYVDSYINGAHWKSPCKVATTGNIDLTTSLENGDIIDGVTLATGDRVLVKNQTTGTQNGIYVVVASGSAVNSRSADLGIGINASAVSIFIQSGTTNGDIAFVCTNDAGTAIVGTNSLDFIQFSSSTTPPGGSDTQVQFNNSGALGGISGITTNGTNSFNFADNSTLNIGSGNDWSISHAGTGTVATTKTGNFTVNNTNASGKTIMKLGSNSSATQFHVENQNGNVSFKVDGTGLLTVPGKITGLSAPTNTTDVTTKGYVDSQNEKVTWKERVITASTANVNISSGLKNGDIIDGITLVTGDRVLLKNQALAVENGIYVVVAAGAASRAADLAAGANASSIAVLVNQGTVNAHKIFIGTNVNGSGVVGTDDLVFTEFAPPTLPGGVSANVQFNNAGTFGGITNWTTDGTGTLKGNDGTIFSLGTTNDFTASHDGTDTNLVSNTGKLLIHNKNVNGNTTVRLGSGTSNAKFEVENSSLEKAVVINGTGLVNFPTPDISGAPGKTGSSIRVSPTTFTDSTTAQEGTAAAHVHYGVARPTLNSANNVTTTTASTFYIENAPASGPNQTIINPYSVWVENGNSLFGGDIFTNSVITTSDTRLKTNIKQLTNPLQKLEKIKGYSYNWKNKEKGEKEQYGVLAQQLEEEGFGHLVSDNGNNKAVNYLGLIPLIIESMKELKKENENLKQEINEMKK